MCQYCTMILTYVNSTLTKNMQGWYYYYYSSFKDKETGIVA